MTIETNNLGDYECELSFHFDDKNVYFAAILDKRQVRQLIDRLRYIHRMLKYVEEDTSADDYPAFVDTMFLD